MAVNNNNNVISGMWSQLQRENKLPKGHIFNSCEKELGELMRQIDFMVHSSNMEWEKERQQMRARVEIKEQEFMIQKSTLEAKHQEVGQLRSQIDGMEKSRRDMAAEYERQLNVLRGEVMSMKKDYERLQKKYNKHARMVQQDKNRATSDQEDHTADLNRLSGKIEEYKAKTREWDEERCDLGKEIDTLTSQNKTLEEKCQLIQHQAATYQSQLGKRKELLDSTETSLRSQIQQLENQLQRSRDTVNSQDTQLGRLKGSLDDAISAQRRAQEERGAVQEQLGSIQQESRRLEGENAALRQDLDAKDDLIQQSQDNVSKLTRDLSRLAEKLQEKDQYIHQLNDSSRQEVEERTNQMLGEMEQLRTSLKKHKRNEKQLLDETGMLQDKLDASRTETAQLSQQLGVKLNEAKNKEAENLAEVKAEITRLKDAQSHIRQTHDAELQGMRKEVAELTTELHHRNISMAQLSEKSADIEKQLRDADENLERRSAELHVATAQLDAIRLENRHLRRNVITNSHGNLNETNELAETEKHLKEIQGAYSESIKTLEAQNERLQEEVESMRGQLRTVESGAHYKLESALRESERSLQRARTDQDRLLRETKLSGDRKVEDVQDKLDDTVNEYERKIQDMRNEMSLLEDELEIQNRSMRRLGLENQAMSHFVDGVDTELHQKQLNGSGSSRGLSAEYRHSSARDTPESFLQDDDFLVDSADLATAQFLAEQNERTKELERKLDLHIQDLERSTDATIQKYLSPR